METITNNNRRKESIGTIISKGFTAAIMLGLSFIVWFIITIIGTIMSNVSGWRFGFISVLLPTILMISLNVLINCFLWSEKPKARKIVKIVCGYAIAACAAGMIILIATASLRPEYTNWM